MCTRRRDWVVLLGLFVGGCAVGPDFQQPPAPAVQTYIPGSTPKSIAGSRVAGGSAQRIVVNRDVPADWWRVFRSQKLNAVLERALNDNPNIEAAMAALRQAQALTLAQQGRFFPEVQGQFNPSRQRALSNPLGSPPVVGTDDAGNPITKNPFNVVTSQVLVSYVLDIWGQNRRAVEGLQAQADFQRFTMEATRLTVASNVALTAIQEAALRDQIRATTELITINKSMVDLLRQQLQSGYANRIDSATQEAQLAQTAATLPPLQKQLGQQRDLLAVLTGRSPGEELKETFVLSGFALPDSLPLSLPSLLVRQRPDVRAAEEQLHAASAQVGVATANLLPNVSISANIGANALALGKVADYLSPTNRIATAALSVTQPIFDGFSLLNQKRAAEENLAQVRAQYRAVVLAALQNVADVLHALQADANALRAASEFEKAAKTSFDLVHQQFERGYINTLLLLNAQQTYLQARLNVIQARANRLADTVALYQALGGGWWNRPEALALSARSSLGASAHNE